MKDLLIVVDMQNDFVTGSLGSAAACAIVPAVRAKVEEMKKQGAQVIFTRDTHRENYLQTQEGRNLPVIHCVEGTEGWQIIPQLRDLARDCLIIDKPTFGSVSLLHYLEEHPAPDRITLIGLCTDICVISNAILCKAVLPEVPVRVVADCCAGVSTETHAGALNAMQVCQIQIL